VDHRNKEMPSCPRHTARLACFQGLLPASARHAAGGPLNADETCGQAGYRAVKATGKKLAMMASFLPAVTMEV
jgi:hypothetical protein